MAEALEQNGKPSAGTVTARLTTVTRFLLAGAINTLLSITVYQVLLFAVSHVVAYLIAYAAGVVIAYYAYTRHVFDATLSTRRFMVFTLFYVASGCAGALLNAALIEQLALHARGAIFVTVVVMLPLNYFGSKWCLRDNAAHQP